MDKNWTHRSSLAEHKRFRKELIPPLNAMPGGMTQIFWTRDLLPEFLWIDSLVQAYGESTAVSIFNDFMGTLDSLVPNSPDILDGTVTQFRLIPQIKRNEALSTVRGMIETAIVRPIGYVLKLYPDGPMNWFVPSDVIPRRDLASAQVRSAVLRLLPGKDAYTAFIRALPLNRYFAHKKIHIASHLTETIQALRDYPHGDRQRAETFARTTHNLSIQHRAEQDPTVFDWPRYFWNRNGALADHVVKVHQ